MARVAELVKKTRDETFIERLENGQTVNMTPAIFSLGGATRDNEWNHLQQKLMRALGIVAIENQVANSGAVHPARRACAEALRRDGPRSRAARADRARDRARLDRAGAAERVHGPVLKMHEGSQPYWGTPRVAGIQGSAIEEASHADRLSR